MLRRTKIVATVGPATDDLDIMDELIASGMDVARVNFSHGDFETHEQRVKIIRERARAQDRHVGIMVDLQGPKIRIEGFKQGSVLNCKTIRNLSSISIWGRRKVIAIAWVSPTRICLNDVKPGDVLLLDDGNISMVVEKLVEK